MTLASHMEGSGPGLLGVEELKVEDNHTCCKDRKDSSLAYSSMKDNNMNSSIGMAIHSYHRSMMDNLSMLAVASKVACRIPYSAPVLQRQRPDEWKSHILAGRGPAVDW